MAELTKHKYDLSEAAGSLGDLGTLLPLMVGLLAINGLNATATLASVGLFYLLAGQYYHLPMPVQPFKVFAAVAIAQGLSAEIISAGALEMAAVLLILSATNLITPIAALFRKPVIRGIQLGLGLTLFSKGGKLVFGDAVFLSDYVPQFAPGSTLNLVLGACAFFLALALINNKKLPAALVLVVGGIVAGIVMGALDVSALSIGFQVPKVALPAADTFGAALMLLALPQLPLTIGNAVIGTCETSKKLLGEGPSVRATPRALCTSMGLANVVFGLFGAMPCCHGAGGLAAHVRFGARTGGSNLMIGVVFIVLALLFGKTALPVLTLIPNSILGVLLCFAGIELSLMVRDLNERAPVFIAITVAGIALVTKNMGIAFLVGIAADRVIEWLKIDV